MAFIYNFFILRVQKKDPQAETCRSIFVLKQLCTCSKLETFLEVVVNSEVDLVVQADTELRTITMLLAIFLITNTTKASNK